MITKEEVKHIAKLARLGLTEKEINKYQKELSSILNYVEKLKEVDVSGVEPTSHPFGLENVMREDLPAKIFKENLGGQAKKLLELAPETKEGYLKVKSIIKLPLPSSHLWERGERRGRSPLRLPSFRRKRR